MPFLGKDWRSDGDMWVKTSHGWETLKNWRVKIHENINYNVLQRLLRQSIGQPEKSDELIECSPRSLYLHIPKISPCRISHGQSAVMITQAVSTLDFAGAFKDVRRANFVYKVMSILINEQLLTMTGAVQNQLFTLLDNALLSVMETRLNKQRLVELLECLLNSLKENQYSFKHMGSNWLWIKNYEIVEQMLDKASNIDIPSHPDDSGLTLDKLPHDVIRHVLMYLCAQQDLVNAGKASDEIQAVVSDNNLWRDLCMCHYRQQLQYHQLKERHRHRDMNWYKLYTKLYRRYGTIESYADITSWCPRCNTLFWKMPGHPCKYEAAEEHDVSPEQFVAMFQV